MLLDGVSHWRSQDVVKLYGDRRSWPKISGSLGSCRSSASHERYMHIFEGI